MPAAKKPTPAQLAARKAFADAARAGTLTKGSTTKRTAKAIVDADYRKYIRSLVAANKNPAIKALSGNLAFNYLVSFKGEAPHAGFDFLRDAKDYAQFIADRDNMSLTIKHRKES